MSQKTRTELKEYFKTSLKPTQAQFAHLIDSFVNPGVDPLKISGSFVGIGTASPSTPLTICAEATHGSVMNFKNAAGSDKWNIDIARDGNAGLNIGETGVTDGRVFIAEGGNVGIGTQAPAGRLHVYGINDDKDTQFMVLGDGRIRAGNYSLDNTDHCLIETMPGANTTLHLYGTQDFGLQIETSTNPEDVRREGINVKVAGASTQIGGNFEITTGGGLGVPENSVAVLGSAIGAGTNQTGVQGYAQDGVETNYGLQGAGLNGVDENAGLLAWSLNGTTSYGVHASASYGTTNYGIHAAALGLGSGTNYGIYATASGGSTNYAGYFMGDVHITGSFPAPSDVILKKNIKPISKALEKVMKLKPKTYDFKKTDPKFAMMNLPDTKQSGFVAQDLETIYPQFVKEVEIVEPREAGKPLPKKHKHQKIKSIAYMHLIPELTAAIQEQQALIDGLATQLDALTGGPAKPAAKGDAGSSKELVEINSKMDLTVQALNRMPSYRRAMNAAKKANAAAARKAAKAAPKKTKK